MKQRTHTDHSRPSWLRFLLRPQALIAILAITLLWRVIAMGQLVYGDIPYFDVAVSKINFLYSWGPEQLGTSVRQGLNTFRDIILIHAAPTNTFFYFLKYVLPLLLIPVTYFYIFRKLEITNRFALVIGSLLPLCTPVVFGDFITGQTFWVYLTVPWVLYYAIQIFCLQRFTLRNSLLLGVMLFLSLGMLPPIIIPLLVSLVLFAGFAFLTSTEPRKMWLIEQYVLAGGIAVLVLAVLGAPYLLVASSGQAAFTSSSVLGDYYHNYSGTYFLNIFRLAGNNGNGQSTLGYNSLSMVNVFGYILFMLTAAGAMFITATRKVREYQSAIISLLVTLLVLFGFLNLLATDMDLGAKIFQSQWIVSTIRNPSKVYTIMLPLFVLLFTFCLQNILERLDGRLLRIVSSVGIVAVVAVYGWPALHGDLGLLFNREEKFATYKQDLVIADIARKAPRDSRSLLMPANHRDELNYQNLNPGLNTLRLEGGMPQTDALLQQLHTALNQRDRYFFNYATAAGIGDFYVKKNEKSYENTFFNLFSVSLSPKQTSSFLREHAPLKDETKDYWHFSSGAANPLIFSPEHITALPTNSSLKIKAPFMEPGAAVVTDPPASFGELTTVSKTSNTITDGTHIAEGRVQLHDPSLIMGSLYSKTDRQGRSMILDVLNPLDGSVLKTYTQAIPPATSIVFIDGEWHGISDTPTRLALRADDYDVFAGSLLPVANTTTDLSFESSAPKAHDATPNADGQEAISSAQSNTASKGKHALQLNSSNHTAFAEIDLAVPETESDYLVTFSYKHNKGAAPSFAIMQDGYSLLSSAGQLSDTTNWQQAAAFATLDPKGSKTLQLFFYTTGSNQDPSENLFDNVQLYAIQPTETGTISLPSYPSDYKVQNYTYRAAQSSTATNLITNGSFEDDKLWSGVGDASAGAGGRSQIRAIATNDAVDGKRALALSSSNHTAYVSRRVNNFDPNKVYKLSFYYKHVAGHDPSYAIWQSGNEIARPSGTLKADQPGWNYFETYFVPERNTSNATLYLYSASNGSETINLYDSVRIEQTSLIETILQVAQPANQQATNIIVDSKRLSPTMLAVHARPGKGLLVFNESFHAGWKAYLRPGTDTTLSTKERMLVRPPGSLIADHTTVNGFANGWWIDSQAHGVTDDYTIFLVYMPQRTMNIGFISTITSGLAIAGYLLYSRNRTESEGWRWRG